MRNVLRLAWLLAIYSFVSVDARAQQLPSPTPPTNPTTGANVSDLTLLGFLGTRSPLEFWLSVLSVLFGLVVIGLLVLFARSRADTRTEDVMRSMVVITVVTGTLLLVTAGYSNQQIAPAFGLFGTIIGYILGRNSRAPAAPGTQASDQQQRTGGG